MHSQYIVLLVILMGFAGCEARDMSMHSSDKRLLIGVDDLPLPALPLPTLFPSCIPCSALAIGDLNVQGVINATQKLGAASKQLTTVLGSVLNPLLSNLQNLQKGIGDALLAIRVTIGPLIDAIKAVVKNLDKCPAVDKLFNTLRDNLQAIFDSLTLNLPLLLGAPTIFSLLSALLTALVQASPKIVTLLKDLLHHLLELLGLCPLAQLTDGLLNPLGPVAGLLKGLLNTLSNALKTAGPTSSIVTSLEGLLGNTGATGNPLDIGSLLKSLICLVLKLLAPTTQLSTCPLLTIG